jgi:predicted RNA-binding Zn ribbon-like protein
MGENHRTIDERLLDPKFDLCHFEPVGGALCLDFANTVGSHGGEEPQEHLLDYADLAGWGKHAGVLSAEEGRSLLARADRRPQEAFRVYTAAVSLREAIYGIFSAIATGSEPEATDIEALSLAFARAMSHAQILREPGQDYQWGWAGEQDDLERILWPIARSAAELLVSDRLDRVRTCGNVTCGWLFVDMSRNRSRRWCDMSDCGNRAKARRFYQRKHDAEPSAH